MTAKGRRRLDAILPQVLAETERAVRGLSAEEVVQLRGLLARMAENLKL
jgi:DNA-binding MarR family transcriptional regulator